MFAKRATGPPPARPKLAKKRTRPKNADELPFQLERVLGLTAARPASLALNPNTDTPVLAYPAGGVVVLYNYRRNRQISFLTGTGAPDGERGSSSAATASRRGALQATRAASCVAYSADGEFLAVGESGHQPRVVIWKGNSIVSELVGHKYGILALAFSPDSKYLVSVGYQHDGTVYLWNWRLGQRLAYSRISTKINSVAFDPQGEFFVTAGTRHMKFWYIDANKISQVVKSAKAVPVLLEGFFASIPDHKINAFADVGCVLGPNNETYTYSITEEGTLMFFNRERQMEKWVDMRVATGRALHITDKYIACGGSDGVIRLFDSCTLQYVMTCPKPHPIDIEPHTSAQSKSSAGWPDVVAVRIDAQNEKVACIYSDHSLYLWDIKDTKHVGKYRSFLWHSDAIWGVEIVPKTHAAQMGDDGSGPSGLPPNSFATYSSDGTVRFWNIDGVGGNASAADAESPTEAHQYFEHNVYSRELLRILYVDRSGILKLKTKDSGSSDTVASGKTGVRALRMTTDGQYLAAGDRLGNVRVYELTHFQQLKYLEAHDAEILTIDFGEDPDQDTLLMATASRDRLLHVFDGQQDFDLVQTLDDHTSSITSIRFAEKGKRLISCGADKSLVFRQADGHGYQSYHNAIGKSTIYDMDIDPTSKYLATASQDRRVNIFSVATGKPVRSYKQEPDDSGPEGGFIKISIDPSGTFAITSASDKSIRMFDFYSGSYIGKVPSGHSELVTGVKFSLDCRHLISTGADGCIFIWKVAQKFVNQMQMRLRTTAEPDTTAIRKSSFESYPASPSHSFFRSDDEHEEIRSVSGRGFRYTETGLPAWARSSRRSETESSDQGRFVAPKGRWAQRVGQEGVVLFSELINDDQPIAKLDDASDRRYTFDVQEISIAAIPPGDLSSIMKEANVAGPAATNDLIRERDAESHDLVVEDLDSITAASTGTSASENEEPTEMDGDDVEEELAIFLPPDDDLQSESAAHVVHIAVPALPEDAHASGDLPASLSIREADSTSSEVRAADEKDKEADVVPESPGETPTDTSFRDKDFGDMTFEDYIQQNVDMSARLDIRQSLSAKHLASRVGGAVGDSTRLLDFVEQEHSVGGGHTHPPTQEGEAAQSTPTSLRQRKQATAQEVERMRQKLAAMGIIWRGSEGNLEEPTAAAKEEPEAEAHVEDVEMQELVPSSSTEPNPASRPEQSSPVRDDTRTATPDRHPAALSNIVSQAPPSAYSSSPPISISSSPMRSVVSPDVTGEDTSRHTPSPMVQLLSDQDLAAQKPLPVSAPASIPDESEEQTTESYDLVSEQELQLLRTLAQRSAQTLVRLASNPDGTDETRRTVQTIQSTLANVRDTAAHVLDPPSASYTPSRTTSSAPAAAATPVQQLFAGNEQIIRTLETYSDILVDIVRQKLNRSG
ncbi:hypothetical protein PhCBS80983_g01246 [Powellomyces hirtus]|uniref:MABP1/WDR62 second WD40 domain-containing protein n=1 Tax=Powellomyces hirtus TaxID=109895 RepID=A0A507EDE9_9FUNG|nr:hypothetical protein PhCBS80983_g01246 [Powellomyces hirtus]